MRDYRLSCNELSELKKAHQAADKKREADKLKAVYLLGKGWAVKAVTEALLLDDETLRIYFDRYKKEGIKGLIKTHYPTAGTCYLSGEEQLKLKTFIEDHPCQSSQEAVNYVQKNLGVAYSRSGLIHLLKRLGFVYKKAKGFPAKADVEAQEKFINDLEKINNNMGLDDVLLFMDATHPRHNSVPGFAWISRHKDYWIPTNSGRNRLNIHGAIDPKTLELVVRFEETINRDTVISLLQDIEKRFPHASSIYIVCDNARYYHAQQIKTYLETSRIRLIFLPPYAPNLNLIERFWKFFKAKVQVNRYYETLPQFKSACQYFFDHLGDYHKSLRSILTNNFEIIGV